MLANHRLSIHVIADSSGETAARLARAAQAQFPQTQFSIVRHPRVKDADALLGVFDRITATEGVFPTVVAGIQHLIALGIDVMLDART